MRHPLLTRRLHLRPAALLGLCCVCVLAAPWAQAQVNRCVDASTGKVSYTDGACASGAKATEIERRKTDEELAQDRVREQEALQAKAERREQELVQRRLQADERAEQREQRAASRAAGNPAQSAACQQSRERYNAASESAADKAMGSSALLDAAKRQMELDCLGPEAYSRLEASRPAPAAAVPVDPYWDRNPYYRPPPPRPPVAPAPSPAPSISRCDVFKCVDTQGYSHPRGQIGETARPPAPAANPRRCRSQGGNAPC